jgi:hypothetical protein
MPSDGGENMPTTAGCPSTRPSTAPPDFTSSNALEISSSGAS